MATAEHSFKEIQPAVRRAGHLLKGLYHELASKEKTFNTHF